MSLSAVLAADLAEAPVDEGEELDFTLDLRVIEASLPLAKMSCDTSDNCGGSTCGSACTSHVAQHPI